MEMNTDRFKGLRCSYGTCQNNATWCWIGTGHPDLDVACDRHVIQSATEEPTRIFTGERYEAWKQKPQFDGPDGMPLLTIVSQEISERFPNDPIVELSKFTTLVGSVKLASGKVKFVDNFGRVKP